MVKPVRILWISAIGVNIAALLFYILLLSKWSDQVWILDILNAILLQILGIPSAALIVASLLVLKFYKEKPLRWWGYTVAFIVIAALLWIAGYLFRWAWLTLS